MKILPLCITLTCCAWLSACATLNEKECRSADWTQLGIADGQNGRPANRLDNHRSACEEYGIRPDAGQYLAGRETGLKQYCQPDNAFRLGMNGESYTGACPAEVDVAFRRNNDAALAVFRSKKQLENINGQLSAKERELNKDGISEQDKNRLRKEIKELERQRERVRQDLRDQQRQLDRLIDKDESVGLPRSAGELIRQILDLPPREDARQ